MRDLCSETIKCWWKKLKMTQMERYSMLIDWINQYCQNVHTTQNNLQIQCNPYQNTNSIFHRNRTNDPKICLEPQKTLSCQSNLEKEELSWRYHHLRSQDILQSYSNENSMTLAQKQTCRSMEENRCSRNKLRLIWSINPWQRRQEYTMGERLSGKTRQLHAKEWN